MIFFTSITLNYLPKARILAKSVKKYIPNAVFYLIIADILPKTIVLEEEPFDKVVQIEELNFPVKNLKQWIFMHSVVELCTAVKGQALVNLLEKFDKVVYLDPDMVVFDNFDEIKLLLEQNSILLTPHQTIPEENFEAILDNEICSLKHGVYNLGFLAVRNSSEGIKFAKWWRDRLLLFCYNDIPNGLFTDQRWVDLAPAFFDDLHVIKETRYNVATWNLTHRKVGFENGRYVVDGKPLALYHFSGFDSGAQEIMLNKYGKNKALFELREWYIAEQDKNGQKEFGKLPSVYDVYSNGEKIKNEHRILYRTRQDVMNHFKTPDLDYLAWYEDEMKNRGKDLSENVEYSYVNEVINSKTWKIVQFLLKIINRISRFFNYLRYGRK